MGWYQIPTHGARTTHLSKKKILMRTKLSRGVGTRPGPSEEGRAAAGTKGPLAFPADRWKCGGPSPFLRGMGRLISDCLESARWEPKRLSPLSF